eukprot:5941481-Pyramimonas_sp.AAC.1
MPRQPRRGPRLRRSWRSTSSTCAARKMAVKDGSGESEPALVCAAAKTAICGVGPAPLPARIDAVID